MHIQKTMIFVLVIFGLSGCVSTNAKSSNWIMMSGNPTNEADLQAALDKCNYLQARRGVSLKSSDDAFKNLLLADACMQEMGFKKK